MSDIQAPVAQRTLLAGNTVVAVTINRPEQDEGDYRCRYLLETGQKKRLGYAMGVDGVQALQLAMARINPDLLAMGEELGVPINWIDNAAGDNGFIT